MSTSGDLFDFIARCWPDIPLFSMNRKLWATCPVRSHSCHSWIHALHGHRGSGLAGAMDRGVTPHYVTSSASRCQVPHHAEAKLKHDLPCILTTPQQLPNSSTTTPFYLTIPKLHSLLHLLSQHSACRLLSCSSAPFCCHVWSCSFSGHARRRHLELETSRPCRRLRARTGVTVILKIPYSLC